MWVESSEWMKLGGNALHCFVTLGIVLGCAMWTPCSFESMRWSWLFIYGWTDKSPSRLVHSTDFPPFEMHFAISVSQIYTKQINVGKKEYFICSLKTTASPSENVLGKIWVKSKFYIPKNIWSPTTMILRNKRINLTREQFAVSLSPIQLKRPRMRTKCFSFFYKHTKFAIQVRHAS